ncbi:MAG: sulfide/dihydroorotate dehydrogenase-like FAD/NAD-binding protein [Candidatus Omnitrophica bacterium]|nr:sulfide/dihydroorotate dehydrogenase-like FAD/NAD-binding protein [Candidatus Omnitrophota bacterium]
MKIVYKKVLSDTKEARIVELRFESSTIASSVEPGQFILLMASACGERVPLTVVDSDPKKGILTIIFQEIGYSTKLLGSLETGDLLYSVVGPLGHATPIENYGKILIVGGGVGIAEILPIVRAFKEGGNHITTILGAKTKDHMILQDEIGQYSDELILTTDDGGLGEKGFVSGPLAKILEKDSDFGLVYCVGPVPMMKVVSNVTKPYNIKTIVCLNAIMLDGTGMCGSCRLTEDGKIKFCCVDGPDFDGHLVDFDELMQRQKRFLKEEAQALRKLHECKLKAQIKE